MTPALSFIIRDGAVGPGDTTGFALVAITNVGTEVKVWAPRVYIPGLGWLPLLKGAPEQVLQHATAMPEERLRTYCHGHALGTYAEWGYTPFSGQSIETILRDEWQPLDYLSQAVPGDIFVWTNGIRKLDQTLVKRFMKKMLEGKLKPTVEGVPTPVAGVITDALLLAFKTAPGNISSVLQDQIVEKITKELKPKLDNQVLMNATLHSARLKSLTKDGSAIKFETTMMSSKNGAEEIHDNEPLKRLVETYGMGITAYRRRPHVGTGMTVFEQYEREELERVIGMPLDQAIQPRADD